MASTLSIPNDAFKQFDRLAFVSRRPARAGTGGEHPSRARAPSTDFVDYRAYNPGDDFRRVDWNIYGRLGSLQVKLTEGRERLDLVLVLDCSSSMAYGEPDKLEFGAQLVAALAYVGTARADSVRVACLTPASSTADLRFGPFRRRVRMPDLVHQLSRLAPAGLVDINLGLSACLGDGPPRHQLVVVISDLLTPQGVAAGLDALQARDVDVALVHVLSPDELEPRLGGEVELIDAESGASLEMGVSLGTLSAYRQRLGTWLGQRAADCHHRGMRYTRVRTDRPLAAVVLDDLRRAGILK
jgi:uncharacterized protein (DUF58 family)